MFPSSVYRPHREAPATARLSPFQAEPAWAGLEAHRFEIVSRGDFVRGILYRPALVPTSTLPLLIVQHGLGGSKESPYLECAARWVKNGFAVALLDLPLHGVRSSPKLSARLIRGVEKMARNETLDLETHVLVEEFARQSTSDLMRAIDALVALDGIDADRVGFVGFSLGAVVGTYLLAHDDRPRAAVLALAGGGAGPVPLDPATHLAQVEKCPVLVVIADADEVVSNASARALFDAAAGPKELLSVSGGHGTLPGFALGRILSFLKEGLGV